MKYPYIYSKNEKLFRDKWNKYDLTEKELDAVEDLFHSLRLFLIQNGGVSIVFHQQKNDVKFCFTSERLLRKKKYKLYWLSKTWPLTINGGLK